MPSHTMSYHAMQDCARIIGREGGVRQQNEGSKSGGEDGGWTKPAERGRFWESNGTGESEHCRWVVTVTTQEPS